jgi:hypothetical protein
LRSEQLPTADFDGPTRLRWSVGSRARRNELSEESAAGTGTSTEDAVLLFVGGPLDGRVEIRAARHGEPLPTVTHVHLHDGPKVVHRYDLEPLSHGLGVYNLRPPARKHARDESVAD